MMRDFHREDFDTAEEFYQALMVENARSRLQKPIFPNQGPREWSPRVGKAVIKVEFLRTLIPPEVLVDFERPESRWDSLTGKDSALVLRVKARKWKSSPYGANPPIEHLIEDNVWIDQDGTIITERGIKDLLLGNVEGYEHLAGSWEKWAAVLGV